MLLHGEPNVFQPSSSLIVWTTSLLRDVPFSAIYFTGYAHLKKDIFREGENGKKLSFFETLTAAGIAGMPAAYLTTPAGACHAAPLRNFMLRLKLLYACQMLSRRVYNPRRRKDTLHTLATSMPSARSRQKRAPERFSREDLHEFSEARLSSVSPS